MKLMLFSRRRIDIDTILVDSKKKVFFFQISKLQKLYSKLSIYLCTKHYFNYARNRILNAALTAYD